MAKWSLPIGNYVAAAKGDLNKAARAVCLELYTRLLIRSPVDSGRFCGNWMIGVVVIPEGFDQTKLNPSRALDAEQLAKFMNYRLGDTIYMRNNLPYAVALENGHSQQAPAGVVKVTVAEFGGIVSKKAREVRSGAA